MRQTRTGASRMMRAAVAMLALIATQPSSAAMNLGVNTHFEQGWPHSAFDKVTDSGAGAIRDVVTWGKVEQQPGRFIFSPGNSGHVDVACSRSIPVLLLVAPRNALYDGGMAVQSAAGQAALARYVGALVDRFPCVIAVQIGNELNTASAKWPPRADKPAMYASMLRAVRLELDQRPRRVALVGGSSIAISVDWHRRMWAAGVLQLVDAVAVHPYTNNPEQLLGQLRRLRLAMNDYGPAKPIWATEFGNYYATPEAAPPHALKVMTMLSASGVERGFWYALLDEPWFPNMGLYNAAAPKPALNTYRLAVQRLLPAGAAKRITGFNDPLTYVFRFGQGPYVMWGPARALRLAAGARVYDAEGREIAIPTTLSAVPIVVDSPGGVALD